jgi:transcription elongation factor Elf1
MTVETRCVIDFGDISSLVFECLHCGARIVQKADERAIAPIQCASCKQEWRHPTQPSPVSQFVDLLNVLKKSENGHFKLKLEFDAAKLVAPIRQLPC